MALRPPSEVGEREQPAAERAAPSPGASGSAGGAAGSAGDTGASVEQGLRHAELRELRARERDLLVREKAAREELAAAREQMAQLEIELEKEQPRRSKRTRPVFDLTPADWKQMAADGVIKYRIPCEGRPPGDDALDELGLAPDDRDVLRGAYEHSAARLRSAVLPLCAAALGDRMEAAQEMSTSSCRQVILSTSDERSESGLKSAQSVASFMAGDAPRPDETSGVTARLFLVLVEESKHFESELAEAFGPEEAHRIAFSDKLCFAEATHHLLRAPR
jgi:hypothetical protein